MYQPFSILFACRMLLIVLQRWIGREREKRGTEERYLCICRRCFFVFLISFHFENTRLEYCVCVCVSAYSLHYLLVTVHSVVFDIDIDFVALSSLFWICLIFIRHLVCWVFIRIGLLWCVISNCMRTDCNWYGFIFIIIVCVYRTTDKTYTLVISINNSIRRLKYFFLLNPTKQLT